MALFIELRNDDMKGYLVDSNKVNEETEKRGAWCWIHFSSDDSMHLSEEVGSGSKMFLFEGAGRYAPAVTAIIHADTVKNAEEIIQERYGKRIKNGNLIRKRGLREIIDERGEKTNEI